MASVTFKPSGQLHGLPTPRTSFLSSVVTLYRRLFPAHYAYRLSHKITVLDRTAEDMGRVAYAAAMDGQSGYFHALVREKNRLIVERDHLQEELDAFLGAL